MDVRDPQTQKVLLGVVLVAGLGYAFWQYVYTPKREQVAELSTQADRLERYNQTAEVAAQANRVAVLEDESVSYAARLQAFEELIPTTEQVPQLLERVATAALESDVDLLSFTPLPAEPGTFYTEQFYEVEVRGGYHEFGSFLTRIANLPRIIKPTITEMLGERVPPPATARVSPDAPPPTLVRAKLQLSTYVLPGGEATVIGLAGAPAAEAPAGGTGLPPVPETVTPPPVPAPASIATGLAPGLAPAFAPPPVSGAQAAETASAAADGGDAARPDTGSVTMSPADAPAPSGPAASDPAPTQPAAQPATPADLTPPGGRSTPTDDPGRPGALPPLGGGN